MASTAGWGYAVIAVRVLQTLAAETPEIALEFLADGLRLAQPEGFIRAFAEAGEPLAPHLQEAALRGILPEYVGQILSAMGKGRIKFTPEQSSLVEPLSEQLKSLVTAG
jgi:LuxR family maltose regulon positive regulatory protein